VLGSARLALRLTGLKTLVARTTASRRPPPLCKPASKDLLGVALLAAPAIDVSGVEEIDTEFQGPVHDLETFFLASVPAEVHGAQTDVAYQDPMFSPTFMFDCHVRVPLLLRLGRRVNFKRRFRRSQAGQFA